MADAPSEPLRTVVLGQGYVGLPLAIRAARVGYQVVGFDTDADRVKRLQAADSLSPDVPVEQIAAALADGLYAPTTRPEDLAGFEVAIIAVPTPLRDGGEPLLVPGAPRGRARVHVGPLLGGQGHRRT